jgi:hypothetical protein
MTNQDRCQAKTQKGERCGNWAMWQGLCHQHFEKKKREKKG